MIVRISVAVDGGLENHLPLMFSSANEGFQGLSSRPKPKNPAQREPEASGEIPGMFPALCRFREFDQSTVPERAALGYPAVEDAK
jgi:hypothetical protein